MKRVRSHLLGRVLLMGYELRRTRRANADLATRNRTLSDLAARLQADRDHFRRRTDELAGENDALRAELDAYAVRDEVERACSHLARLYEEGA